MFQYARGISDFLYVGFLDSTFALIFVGAGVWSCLRGMKNTTNLSYMRRQLVIWKVSAPEMALSSPLIAQATSAVARLRGWGLLGAGMCALLNTLFWMSFALITNINPTHDQPLISAAFNTTWLISLLVGYGVGHAAGVWHLRQLAKYQPAYGDIRRRSLDDYRAPIIGWVCPAIIVVLAIVTALLLPHVHATNGIPSSLDPRSSAFLLDGFLLPAQMVAIVVIMELVLRWVAQLPRLLIVPEPTLAQRADDIVRATTIGALQGWEIILVSLLGEIQWSVLYGHLSLVDIPLPFQFLSFGILVMLLVGLTIYLIAHGRLGGTLTGWPWQAMLKRGE